MIFHILMAPIRSEINFKIFENAKSNLPFFSNSSHLETTMEWDHEKEGKMQSIWLERVLRYNDILHVTLKNAKIDKTWEEL